MELTKTSGTLVTGKITATATAGSGAAAVGEVATTKGTNGVLALAEAVTFDGSDMFVTSSADLSISASASNASGAGWDIESVATEEQVGVVNEEEKGGNVAVAVQETGSNIQYSAAGKFNVLASAGQNNEGKAITGEAQAAGMLLQGGETTITAQQVNVFALSISADGKDSVATGVELTEGHKLNIVAIGGEGDTNKGVNILVDSVGATDAISQADGLTADDSTITVRTDGEFFVAAGQWNANASTTTVNNEVSYAVAIDLDNSELDVVADGGITIAAKNAIANDKEHERSLLAKDSTITLDAGKDKKIEFKGNAELHDSELYLHSDTKVEAGAASAGSLIVTGSAFGNAEESGEEQGEEQSTEAKSLVYLMKNAKSLDVANNATFTNTEIHFYDGEDASDKYIGGENHAEYTQDHFRTITVGRDLKLGGEDSLFIRTNSLATNEEGGGFADVGDRIVVKAGEVIVVDDNGEVGQGANKATVNINVFDEGMKIGYNAQKDGTGYADKNNQSSAFDGRGFGDNGDGRISVIEITGENGKTISSDVEIGEVTAVSYDNGVWAYDYEVQAEKSVDGTKIELTQVATTKATASSAQKTASDANKIAAAAAVSFFGADETLHERLGDIRALSDANEKDNNVWAKYVGGRLKADGIGGDTKVKYNGVEIGYDRYVGNNWTVGVAGEYIKGDTTLTSGSGEIKSKAGAVYGTWLGEKGHHLDIVGKIGRVDSETTSIGGTITNKMEGDFDANAYSLSVEYGYKYDLDNNWYVAPAARLSYVHMGSADYDVKALNNTMHAVNDSFNSLVLRAGARVGTKLGGNGSLYFKLAALYDFDGDVATTLTADGRSNKYETDLGGFGLEYGLGYDQAFGKNSSLYLDVERISGSDLKKDWGVNVGVRFSF